LTYLEEKKYQQCLLSNLEIRKITNELVFSVEKIEIILFQNGDIEIKRCHLINFEKKIL